MRKAFSETLVKLAEKDPKIVFVTGDMGYNVFNEFERRFPDRFINAGVAEAEMINVAAGLAAEGFKPITYSITSFATGRPFEQIRYCVAYPEMPVMMVGAGRGFLYSNAGVSHHAIDDVGIMRIIPGITITTPADPFELRELMPQLLNLGKPSYMSVGKYGEPSIPSDAPVILGKGRKLFDGEKIAIFSTAEITYQVFNAVSELKSEGFNPALFQFHTIRPFDKDLLDELSKKFHKFLIIDEHLPVGGLWNCFLEWKAETNADTRMFRLGPPEKFFFGNLDREELRKRYGYDKEAIIKFVKDNWQNS